MVVILDAILNFTPSAREPDYPPKFFFTYLGMYYQDQESKCGDIWLHTGFPQPKDYMHTRRAVKIGYASELTLTISSKYCLHRRRWVVEVYLEYSARCSHCKVFLFAPHRVRLHVN